MLGLLLAIVTIRDGRPQEFQWHACQAIRTAPMLNQPVKEVWPICHVDVQIGKEGNAAPVGLYMHPQINSERGGSLQWRGAAHMAAGCSGDSVPSGRR